MNKKYLDIIKKLNFYFACVVLFSAFQCTEDDEGITIDVELQDAVTIEGNQTVFMLNDEIIINTVIPNSVVSTEGESIVLSDYMYFEEDEQYVYYYL